MYRGYSMNIGIIFAGGTGQRMSSTGTPKQLLEVNGNQY